MTMRHDQRQDKEVELVSTPWATVASIAAVWSSGGGRADVS
jgi:hypothetical protein